MDFFSVFFHYLRTLKNTEKLSQRHWGGHGANHWHFTTFSSFLDFLWMFSPFCHYVSIIKSDTSPNSYRPIGTIGNFCSFICANNWILTEIPRDKRWEKIELLKLLHKILTGVHLLNIPEGPARTKMVQFDGSLTTADFQARIKLISSIAGIVFPENLYTTYVTPEDAAITTHDLLLD